MARKASDPAFTLDDTTVDKLLSTAEPGSHAVWLVTAAQRAEGTTTVALGLARALAARHKRTVLVDADLRVPELHRRLGVPSQPGLGQAVGGDSPIDEAIHPAAADVPGCAGLSLVPAGQFEADPFEMLGSPAMAELVAELKQRFDYTVIDSPPLESSLDATRLASLADGVVLVVRAGKTRSAMVRDAQEQLAKAGAKMAGVVLNQYRDYLPRWLRRWL